MKKNKKINDLMGLEVDENQRTILKMQVLDDSNFLSPYCGEEVIANDEVISFLNNSIKKVNFKTSICLNIKSQAITSEKKEVYALAIKNYYQNEKKQILRELFFNLIASLTMFFIGVIVISIMLFASWKNQKEIWINVLDIIGWVFIWESVDKFAFERTQLKRQFKRTEQFINAEINFVEN